MASVPPTYPSRWGVALLLLAASCTDRTGAEPDPTTAEGTGGDTSQPATNTGDHDTTEGGPSTTPDSDGADSSGEPPLPTDGLGPWGFDYVEHSDIEVLAIEFGEFNNDGLMDFFALRENDGAIYIGDGAGGFTEFASMHIPSQNDFPRIADFDGDGWADIAMFDDYSNDDFYVVLNNGAGGFTQRVSSFIDGFFGFGVIELDANGDEAADLFIPLGHSQGAALAIAQGDGSFVLDESVPVHGCYLSDTAVADLDGDGLGDVVTTGSCNSVPEIIPLAVYLHAGGTFEQTQNFFGDVGPLHEGADLVLVDADGDGDLDAATGSDSGLFVALNEGDGAFSEVALLIPHTYPGYSHRLMPLNLGADSPMAYLMESREDEENSDAALVRPAKALDDSATEILDMRGRLAASADVDGDARPDVAVLVGEQAPFTVGVWLSGG